MVLDYVCARSVNTSILIRRKQMSPSDSQKVGAEVREERDARLMVWETETEEVGGGGARKGSLLQKREKAVEPSPAGFLKGKQAALWTCSRCFTSRTIRE